MMFRLTSSLFLILGFCLRGASGWWFEKLPVVTRYYPFSTTGAGALCSQFQRCEPPLKCQMWVGRGTFGLGVCNRHLGLGDECNRTQNECPEPLQCQGQCVQVGKLGAPCKSQTYLVCGDGMKCRNNRCISEVGYGAVCGSNSTCRSGLFCNYGHCHVNVGLGESCGFQFSRCIVGSTCLNGRCLKVLRTGQLCDAPHSQCTNSDKCVQTEPSQPKRCHRVLGARGYCSRRFVACTTGLGCVGPPRRKFCLAPQKIGASCQKTDHSYFYCGKGLVCDGTGSRGICKRVVDTGMECGNKNVVCAEGFTCVIESGKKVCKGDKLELGEDCGNNSKSCLKDLVCATDDGGRKCTRVLGINSDCGVSHSYCRSGLQCVGFSRKRCVAGGKPGDKCGSLYEPCSDGLSCVESVCVRSRTNGKNCSEEHTLCEQGLVCGSNGVCRLPELEGVPLGGDCDNINQVCQDGTYCVGYPYRRHCSYISHEGGKCGVVGYTCARGLECMELGNSTCCLRHLYESVDGTTRKVCELTS